MDGNEVNLHKPGTGGAQLTPPPRPAMGPAGAEDIEARPARDARWSAAAWIGGAIVLFAILLRISESFPMDSDAANNALQAWDMLHGNLLLHGWIIGDATYYLTELPLYVLVESVFGLHTVVPHIVSALVYVAVVGFTAAIARTGSRGAAAWIRTGVVVAILAAPLTIYPGVSIAMEKPDHTGTSAIIVACFLLIDRAAGRLFMPVVLCVILVLGQVSDATVLYVAVPAIGVVSLYRIIFRRRMRLIERVRSPDMLALVAAGLSYPLASLIQSGLRHGGGYSMISPRTSFAHWSQIPHNLALMGKGLLTLFGALGPPPGIGLGSPPLGLAGIGFGYLCIAAGLYGFGRVLVTWHRASRAEQLLCVAIVVNIAAYVFSSLPVPSNARELIAVVPCAAALAARALVPAQVRSAATTRVLAAIAAVAAAVPLLAAATLPAVAGTEAPLATWLEAHGLTYGVGGYWNASAVTLQSGGRVQVVAVTPTRYGVSGKAWEANSAWYDPARHRASFAIANFGAPTRNNVPVSVYEKAFGRPSSIHEVAGQLILIYQFNVLTRVAPVGPGRT